MTPPPISPNAVNNSVGGRDGNTLLGGRSHRRKYVRARANAAPASKFPHCLCTMLEIMLSCVCELIIKPSKKMTNAGMGLAEKE